MTFYSRKRGIVSIFDSVNRVYFTGSWSALYLIGDAARVGYFVPLNGPLNGHPPSIYNMGLGSIVLLCSIRRINANMTVSEQCRMTAYNAQCWSNNEGDAKIEGVNI